MTMQASNDIQTLLNIMAKLRDPQSGCDWDLAQNFGSIVPFTLEEAYEVADAIERADWQALPSELGDLLFQVVFYCQLAQEQGMFDFRSVVERISDKLIRRHPHVFTDTSKPLSSSELKQQWEILKSNERAEQQQYSLLDDIPQAMPALSRSMKIQKRVAQVGFDWDELPPVIAKVYEEIDEVMEEVNLPARSSTRITEEVGDLLFAVVNMARHLGVEPEQALRQANRKFERRFRGVEALAAAQQKPMQQHTLDELELYWQQVKSAEIK